MGLFSDKKKYVAYAASSALFEQLPGTLKNNIVQTTISGASKADAIFHTIMTDQFARAKAMMRYAERYDDPLKTGGYVRGFPTSNMELVNVDASAVETALTAAVGAYDDIITTYTGAWNESFFLQKRLQEVYDDPVYFPWGIPADSTHWDGVQDSVQIPVINPDTSLYYTSDNEYSFSRDASDVYQVSFPYVDNLGADQVWDVAAGIDLSGIDANEWIMVIYQVGTEYFYWAYEIGSGDDPVLEAAITTTSKEGAFLPVAVLMQDEVWFDDDPNSELAITTNKLLKKLSTSGTDIREDFQEQEAIDDAENDEEKSNAKKWDFFIHYAVPIDTKVRGSRQYLWEFFDELQDWSTSDSDDYYAYLASGTSSQPINELIITEAGDNGYHVAYRWSFIDVRSDTGAFMIEDPKDPPNMRALKPKEVTSELIQHMQTTTARYQEVVDSFFGPSTPVGDWADPTNTGNAGLAALAKAGYHDLVLLTRATDDGLGYEQMLVLGLSMQYVINTKNTDTGGSGFRYRYATPQLFGLEEETKEFRIPLLYRSLRKVPTIHREEACADGLTATVFLVEVIKTKWYQTGFFKWLLIIIAIVLIIISIWFPFLIQGAISILGAALGGGGLALFVAYVVVSFAIGYMIALGTSLMSPNMQMILAVVIFIAMLYTGQFQNLKSTFTTFKSAPGWGSAAALINAVGPIYNMGFSVYSQYTIAKYEEEFRDLMLDQRERQQILEDAWDSFGPVPSWLDPMELQNSFDRAGSSESAESYYTRVLTANPGVLGYDLINNWAENATTLPKDPGPTLIDSMMNDFEQQRG